MEKEKREREDFLKVSFYKDLFVFIFWLWWIFVAGSGLSLVAVCRFLTEKCLFLLQSMSSRVWAQ